MHHCTLAGKRALFLLQFFCCTGDFSFFLSRSLISSLICTIYTMETLLTFWCFCNNITEHNKNGSFTQGHRKFGAFLGTSPTACFVVWNMFSSVVQESPNQSTSFRALLLLEQYSIERINDALVGASEKTFHKRPYIFIRLLAHIRVVNQNKSLYYYPKLYRNNDFSFKLLLDWPGEAF